MIHTCTRATSDNTRRNNITHVQRNGTSRLLHLDTVQQAARHRAAIHYRQGFRCTHSYWHTAHAAAAAV